jgi:hypothetical protein
MQRAASMQDFSATHLCRCGLLRPRRFSGLGHCKQRARASNHSPPAPDCGSGRLPTCKCHGWHPQCLRSAAAGPAPAPLKDRRDALRKVGPTRGVLALPSESRKRYGPLLPPAGGSVARHALNASPRARIAPLPKQATGHPPAAGPARERRRQGRPRRRRRPAGALRRLGGAAVPGALQRPVQRVELPLSKVHHRRRLQPGRAARRLHAVSGRGSPLLHPSELARPRAPACSTPPARLRRSAGRRLPHAWRGHAGA